MQIRYGFDIELSILQPTTIIALMDVHPSRRHAIVNESGLQVSQDIQVETFIDTSGNMARRLSAQPGTVSMRLQGVIRDSGQDDPQDWAADAASPAALPPEVLPFLMASRYCEVDLLTSLAWSQFGGIVGGWARVQAICDYVHNRLTFSYPNARETRTAAQAREERSGVCRDFAHLAITLCRAMNIPARFCNGYLGDIGVPVDPAPMDFNAWFEVYLAGRWWTFDARHNVPRIGRILIATGRDAIDAAMITTFGSHRLDRFSVTTEEISSAASMAA